MGDAHAMQHILGIVQLMAGLTVVAVYAAVKLQDLPAPGKLVQAVNILRHDRLHLACRFQLSKLLMCHVRLCCQAQHFVAVKTVKLFCVPSVKCVA